jgi:hypothetical protein
MDKIEKIQYNDFNSETLVEKKVIQLGEIKEYIYNNFKLEKSKYFKNKFLLIPTIKELFKSIFFPVLYLIFAPIIILLLNKKNYIILKEYNTVFNEIEININSDVKIFEKIIYIIIGVLIWIITPIMIIYMLIEITKGWLFNSDNKWHELIKSIDKYGYSPENFNNKYITVSYNDKCYKLIDGNHRYKILLDKYGKDYIIDIEVKSKIEKKPVIIKRDDGYQNNGKYGWDKLLKSLNTYGYVPEKFPYGYLVVYKLSTITKIHLKLFSFFNNLDPSFSNNFKYGLTNGNHRHKVLIDKYGKDYSIVVKEENSSSGFFNFGKSLNEKLILKRVLLKEIYGNYYPYKS